MEAVAFIHFSIDVFSLLVAIQFIVLIFSIFYHSVSFTLLIIHEKCIFIAFKVIFLLKRYFEKPRVSLNFISLRNRFEFPLLNSWISFVSPTPSLYPRICNRKTYHRFFNRVCSAYFSLSLFLRKISELVFFLCKNSLCRLQFSFQKKLVGEHFLW